MLETTRFTRLGTPLSSSATKVMLLGSGELGKEFKLHARAKLAASKVMPVRA